MKPKTLLLTSVAVLCGLGASYLTSRLLENRRPDEIEKVRILVAKRQMNMGDTIKVPQEAFEEREYIKDQEPRDALVKFEDMKGRVLKKGLRPGDFIRLDDLVESKDVSIAGALPQGYRAMSQRVALDSGGLGFIVPYSRVDVVQTVRRGDDGFAKILLDDVLVIAVGTDTNPRDNVMPTAVVTFALSPENALKLHLAREVGAISLILRKFNDHGPSPIVSVNASDLKHSPPNRPVDTDGTVEATPAPVTNLPLNPSAAEPAVVVKNAATNSWEHIMTFIEGQRISSVNYQLDEKGRVVNPRRPE